MILIALIFSGLNIVDFFFLYQVNVNKIRGGAEDQYFILHFHFHIFKNLFIKKI